MNIELIHSLSLPPAFVFVGAQGPLKNCRSHIDASHSRQPLVKGERLVRYEVNAVMACNSRVANNVNSECFYLQQQLYLARVVSAERKQRKMELLTRLN